MSDTTNIQRDSQVGTLKHSCATRQMLMVTRSNVADHQTFGHSAASCTKWYMEGPPFAEHKTFWAKFKVITNPNHEIKYPPLRNPYLLDLMQKCLLAWDRDKRWRIPQLLDHPFLRPPIPPSPSQTCRLLPKLAQQNKKPQASAPTS
ncbi:unnamed protein product [Rhodiola kirilowii]